MNKTKEQFFTHSEFVVKQKDIKQELLDMSLNPDVFVENWLMAANSLENAIKYNIPTMRSLEKKSKGICKTLTEKFRIFNFGRYPQELLLKQYKEMEFSRPYGIVLVGGADNAVNQEAEEYSEVFYQSAFKQALKGINKQLGSSYALRVAECRSVPEMARLYSFFKKKYSNRNKCEFLYINSHSGPDYIDLGFWPKAKNHEKEQFSVNDINTTIKDRHYWKDSFPDTDQFFSENATIIINGCEAGQEKGIAEALANKLKRKVIASADKDFLYYMRINDSGGKLEFNAKYAFGSKPVIFSPKNV